MHASGFPCVEVRGTSSKHLKVVACEAVVEHYTKPGPGFSKIEMSFMPDVGSSWMPLSSLKGTVRIRRADGNPPKPPLPTQPFVWVRVQSSFLAR